MSLFSSYPGKVAQAQRRRDLTWEGEQLNVNATNLSLLGSSAPYCVSATSKKFKTIWSWVVLRPETSVFRVLKCRQIQDSTSICDAWKLQLLQPCGFCWVAARLLPHLPRCSQRRMSPLLRPRQKAKREAKDAKQPCSRSEEVVTECHRSIWLLNQKLLKPFGCLWKQPQCAAIMRNILWRVI